MEEKFVKCNSLEEVMYKIFEMEDKMDDFLLKRLASKKLLELGFVDYAFKLYISSENDSYAKTLQTISDVIQDSSEKAKDTAVCLLNLVDKLKELENEKEEK